MSDVKKRIRRIAEQFGAITIKHFLSRHRPKVLMYHRISDHPYFSGISPGCFEKQIAYIQKKFRVIPVEQLIDELSNNALKPHTLALTFDDGYADFFHNAWPVLKKYNVPATLFVPTGFVDRSQWLWPDLIKFILMKAAPQTSYLSLSGYKKLDSSNLMNAWNEFGDHCLKLSAQDRDVFIKNLANHFDVGIPNEPINDFSSVTWSQLNDMQSEGLDIGSYTVTHPGLASLKQSDIVLELTQSASRIEEMTGRKPVGICYPYGRIEDVNTTVINTAKESGYGYGVVACNNELNRDSLYTIGRIASTHSFEDFKWATSGLERPIDVCWNLS